MNIAKLIRSAIEKNGPVILSFNKDSILNMMVDDVELTNRETKKYAANITAENSMYDLSSNYAIIMEGILDYNQYGTAVLNNNIQIITKLVHMKLGKISWKIQV